MPDHYIPQYEKQFGRPCLYVGLYAINEEASLLVMLALNQYAAPLASLYAPILLSAHTPHEIREMLDRATGALASGRLHDALEKSAKAKAKADTKGKRH